MNMLRDVVLAVVLLLVAMVGSHPCAAAVPPTPKKFTLVIDAGHGGHDPGAVGRTAKEKNINLATALAFGKLVEANCPDVNVVYTRKTDVFVTLQGRAQIANRNKADLFISIHTNALPKGKVTRGAETYTLGMARANENLEVAKRENSVILVENDYQTRYQGFDPNSSESYIIFGMMQDRNMAKSVALASDIQREFGRVGRRDKGVHQAGFLVLRETTMAGVLVELGYITTPDEEQFLASKAGSDKMGRAIYNAFAAYYRAHASTQEELPVQEGVKQAETDSVEQTAEVDAVAAEASAATIEFRVQFATSSVAMDKRKYRNLKDPYCYLDGRTYKYTAGCFARYADAQSYRNQIAKTYKDAFVIAMCDGTRMDLNEARKKTK